ncbi:hypothetical protein [Gordonia amicalis]|uniref:hypothetical protein n=1 Tax=Gordonia amicalis TaxID=89053 RepID=UPI003A7F645A
MTAAKLPVQKQPPPLDDLVEPLKEILKAGLPVSYDFDDMNILALRGVVARSVMPHDRLSRIKALNELLARLLVHYPDDSLGEAARIVCGLAPGVRGLTLTQRRDRAAAELDRDADHFRKRIEPKIVRELARQLHSDSQNYVPRTTPTPEPVEISGDTPYIAAGDVASHDKALREEALSRVWAHVYTLRAEILRVERLKAWPYDKTEPQLSQEKLDDACQARMSAQRAVHHAVHAYIEEYGSTIASGVAEYDIEGLEKLMEWDA